MKKPANRIVIAALGMLVLLSCGLIESWSVIARPISAEFPQWNATQMSTTFTITMFCFCIGGMSGGWIMRKFSSRKILWFCAVLYAAGFMIAASMQNLVMLYIGFGLLTGYASGLAYTVALTSVVPWFPEKNGLITGTLTMCFGLGIFFTGKIFAAVMPVDGTPAWRSAFRGAALIMFLILVTAGIFIRRPREEEIREQAAKAGKPVVRRYYEDVPTGEMIKRSSFWLFILWTIAMAGVNVTVLSQASNVVVEAAPTLAQGTVATIIGIQAIINGIGRLPYGVLFDKIGRLKCMVLDVLIFSGGMGLLLAAIKTHTVWLLIPGFFLSGLASGWMPTTIACYAHLFYGEKYYPTNYSIINTNLLVSSFAGMLAGAVYDASGTYAGSLLLALGYLAVALVLCFAIREPSCGFVDEREEEKA